MPRRLALLISNSQYHDTRLARLLAPAADASALAKVLQDPQIGAFDEALNLLNRPLAETQKAIEAFFADKKPDDLLLLYFSGHGLEDDKSRRLYLATPESDINLLRSTSISAAFIAEEMSNCRSKNQVLVLDCCNGGAFSRGVKAALNQPVDIENIFQTEGAGRIVMTASAAKEFAFEGETLQGEGVRSVFTRYLVEGLETGAADKDGDGKIGVLDWYDYAYQQVKMEKPNQTPLIWTYGMRGNPLLAQNPRPAAAPQPAPVSIVQPPSAKSVRTLVVDQLLRGDYDTITEAIQNANPGDRILIREGVYEEALVLDKVLELVGDGKLGEVEIRAYGKHVIHFKTSAGLVRNLVLRQTGGEGRTGVYITQGRLRLEGCDISSQSLAGVAICNSGTAPVLRGNKIHEGKEGGIMVYDNAQGLIEANEIWGNAYSGIEIREGAAPTVRNNKIHDGKSGGIHVYENGQGLIEANEIWGNAYSGIEIKTGSAPTVRNNKIHDGKASGVFVNDNGQGLIEANEVWGNANSGIAISTGANPTVRKNKIHDGKQNGIFSYEKGQGLLEANEIWGNAYSGIEIREGATPIMRVNTITKNKYRGIYVHDKGGGTIENNDLRGNEGGAWNVSADSLPFLSRKNNQE